MKLYTEDDLKEAFNFGRLYQGIKGDTNIYHLIDKLTPIELPSDEEIEERKGFEYPSKQQDAFQDGAKWMRDKIKGETYLKCTCSNSLEYSNCSKKCERIIKIQGGNK